MCILESSELLMYEFYYDYNKNKDGNNSRLLFPDFDSLTYEITTEDLYEDYGNDKEILWQLTLAIIQVTQIIIIQAN